MSCLTAPVIQDTLSWKKIKISVYNIVDFIAIHEITWKKIKCWKPVSVFLLFSTWYYKCKGE